MASFVFTTNNVRPLALDRDDRRNTFFETNGSSQAKERAATFYRLGEARQRNAWEGLAELLSMIEIDEQLISKAITTDVKERMISSGVDPFDEWFQTDEVLQSWPVGEFAPVAWIKRNYTYWARDNAYRGCATSAYCQDKLNELVSEASLSPKLRKTLHDGTKLHGYVRRCPETELDEHSLKNCRPISLYRKGPNADKVRDKILHGRGPRRSAN